MYHSQAFISMVNLLFRYTDADGIDILTGKNDAKSIMHLKNKATCCITLFVDTSSCATEMLSHQAAISATEALLQNNGSNDTSDDISPSLLIYVVHLKVGFRRHSLIGLCDSDVVFIEAKQNYRIGAF